MPLSKNISAYEDVRAVLDAAVANGGGRVRLESVSTAIRWRQRANHFRKLIAERDGSTPWDEYQLLLELNSVIILKRPIPNIESFNGETIAPATVDDTDLLEQAAALKRRLNIE